MINTNFFNEITEFWDERQNSSDKFVILLLLLLFFFFGNREITRRVATISCNKVAVGSLLLMHLRILSYRKKYISVI